MDLDKLITQIEDKMNCRDLSDEYLREHDCPTREDIGIGEYSYGITIVPCSWVYPYLKKIKSMKEDKQC